MKEKNDEATHCACASFNYFSLSSKPTLKRKMAININKSHNLFDKQIVVGNERLMEKKMAE